LPPCRRATENGAKTKNSRWKWSVEDPDALREGE
jgi:hypothetical protein